MNQPSDEQQETGEKLSTADLAAGARPAAEKANTAQTGDAVPAGPSPAPPAPAPARPGGAPTGQAAPLFPSGESETFRSRWDDIQAGFVDDPRRTIEQADGLVAEAMKRLAQTFSDERSKLEQQWQRGGDVSTEDLRVAFQRYRSFFQRLLTL